jgi:hypothetical protein
MIEDSFKSVLYKDLVLIIIENFRLYEWSVKKIGL